MQILISLKETDTLPIADNYNALTSHTRYGFSLVYALLTHDQHRNTFPFHNGV